MTENQIKEFYNELVEYYGEKLANPEIHPRIFTYQVKCYKYYNKIGKEYEKSDEPVELKR